MRCRPNRGPRISDAPPVLRSPNSQRFSTGPPPAGRDHHRAAPADMAERPTLVPCATGRAEEVDFDARHQDLLLRDLRVLPQAPLMLVTHIRGLEGRRPHSTLGRDRQPRECRRRHGLQPRRSGPRRSDAGRRAVRKLRERTGPSRAFGGIKGATTRLTAPAYWKFESIPLQQRVCKLSVPLAL